MIKMSNTSSIPWLFFSNVIWLLLLKINVKKSEFGQKQKKNNLGKTISDRLAFDFLFHLIILKPMKIKLTTLFQQSSVRNAGLFIPGILDASPDSLDPPPLPGQPTFHRPHPNCNSMPFLALGSPVHTSSIGETKKATQSICHGKVVPALSIFSVLPVGVT